MSRADSVYKMAKMMRPYLFKKREDIDAIIDYLDDKITGTRFAELFNESVSKGNRTGKIRFLDIPYTRSDGQILRKIESAEHARQMGMKCEKYADDVIQQVRRELVSGVATAEQIEEVYYRLHPSYKK